MGLAWEFFCVCAPIVVVGAPLGSVLGSYVHRLVLAAFVYATDFVQLIGALIVVQPWSREKCTKELAPAKEMALGPSTCNPTHLCSSSAVSSRFGSCSGRARSSSSGTRPRRRKWRSARSSRVLMTLVTSPSRFFVRKL